MNFTLFIRLSCSPRTPPPLPQGSARLYCCMDSDLPSRYSWDVLALAHKIPQHRPPPPAPLDSQDLRPALRIPEADSGTHLPNPSTLLGLNLSAHRCYLPPQSPLPSVLTPGLHPSTSQTSKT